MRGTIAKYGDAPTSLVRALLAMLILVSLSGCVSTDAPATDNLRPEVQTKTAPGHPLEGMPAPTFTAPDLDGNAVSLSDFQGQPILFHIWASWCTTCEREESALDELYTQYGDRVAFLMVSVDSASYERQMREDAADWEYGTLWNSEGNARRDFQVRSQPVTIFIDSNGTIDTVWEGLAGSSQGITLRAQPVETRAILDRLLA
jgi:peroxiredoxin